VADRFDITRVRLRHYRSIASCDVTLGPMTLLVGPNSSGKSSFLDALRLTAQALTENLDNALRERGGADEVRHRSRGLAKYFSISVDFGGHLSYGTYSFLISAVDSDDYRVAREECEIWSTGSRQQQKFVISDGQLAESTEAVMPRGSADRLYLVAASGLEPFRPVYDGLANINVYNVNPDAMRRLQRPESGDLLRRDGSNIASVLERLSRESPETKNRIEEYLSRVVGGVLGVNRQQLGSWETIEFRQVVTGDPNPWTFPATSMSDGTLRALGVLCALLAGHRDSDSPVGIEEPEAALHPAAAGLLLDALRDAGTSRQVLVTTHSPDLLDSSAIKPTELLAVRAVNGVTEIAPIDQAGQQAIRESLYTPGELLRADQLIPDPEHTQPELHR
jgi:predicted ATPase